MIPPTITTYIFDKKFKLVECVICLALFDCRNALCFGTKLCHHGVCHDCLYTYLNQVLKDDIYFESYDLIYCPGEECKKTFNTDKLIKEVFGTKEEVEKWWDSAISSRAYVKNKVKCPIKGCGAVFDVDEELRKKCVFTECIVCHKGICVTCQSPWHPGVKKVFVDKDALRKTLSVAKKSSWSRCPGCRNIVEKKGGCSEIHCICGIDFCYNCGLRIYASSYYSCDCWSKRRLENRRNEMFKYKEQDA